MTYEYKNLDPWLSSVGRVLNLNFFIPLAPLKEQT
jgi:hypothetical protein